MNGKNLRRSILSLLLEAFPQDVSGEHIASLAGVSRVAVWKVVQELKAQGFPVAASRKGYRLLTIPDSFDPDVLEPYLAQEVQGIQVVYEEEVDSTNTRLKTLAEGGAPEGTLFVAESQTRGRGRRGRSWFSLPGKSLTFSLLLRPCLSPEVCPSLALLAGIALSKALEDLGFSPKLKWPNDLLLAGKKVAGILLETATDLDEVPWVVLGVGVNVNLKEEEVLPLPFPATSLRMERGEPVLRVLVLRRFLVHFFEDYREWKQSGDFSPWVAEYNHRFAFMGKSVTVSGGRELVSGVVRGVDARGALRLEKDGEEVALTWGEIA
ncbi:MAG: biotin--[acetyl-CoA-carboxylase] ligase [Atribacterota bacterium]